MTIYCKPSTSNFGLKNFVITQSVSGEVPTPLIPLDCEGRVAQCQVGPLGASCFCDNVTVTFLVPGVNCSDINNGKACSISSTSSTSCAAITINALQCGEGCAVEISCDTGQNCQFDDYTASCPGFETCATNTGSDGECGSN